MDMTARATDIQVILTRREFNLVTKALTGKLSPEPHPKCSDDDVPDAYNLGQRLMEKRIRCAEYEVELLEKALEKATGGE
jgi:hypothetical protein